MGNSHSRQLHEHLKAARVSLTGGGWTIQSECWYTTRRRDLSQYGWKVTPKLAPVSEGFWAVRLNETHFSSTFDSYSLPQIFFYLYFYLFSYLFVTYARVSVYRRTYVNKDQRAPWFPVCQVQLAPALTVLDELNRADKDTLQEWLTDFNHSISSRGLCDPLHAVTGLGITPLL